MDRATLSELQSLSSALLSTGLFRKYVFTSEPFTNPVVVGGIQSSLRGFANKLVDTLLYLVVFAVYIFAVCAKLATLGSPHAIKIISAVIDFHRTKLKPMDLLIEALILVLFALYAIYRKRIRRAWVGIEKSIEVKSEVAARLAPHALFFTSAVVVTILAGNIITPVALAALPFVSLFAPLLRTALLLSRAENASGALPSYIYYRQYISMWVVLGIFHCLGSLLALLPFSQRLFLYTPYVKEVLLLVLLWMHVSPLFTEIVYEAANPIMELLASKIPAMSLLVVKQTDYDTPPKNSPSSGGAFGGIIQSLSFMKLLSESQISILRALLEDGVVFFLTLTFILTPSPLALVGEYLVTWALPVFRSASTLSGVVAVTVDSRSDYSNTPVVERQSSAIRLGSNPNLNITSKKKKGGGATIVDDSGRVKLRAVERTPYPRDSSRQISSDEALLVRERRRWLEYWLIIGSVLALRKTGFVYLLPSMQMLLALYLQHSYMKGASRVVDYLSKIRNAVRIRGKDAIVNSAVSTPIRASSGEFVDSSGDLKID